MIYTESPDILVLIARDGDYYGTLLEAIDYKWKIEILEIGVLDQFKLSTLLFPIGVSGHLKGNNKIHYIQLEIYYKFFVYATGANSDYYNKINTFEISCDTIVEDKEIVEWFANLNLFSWIHQKGNNIILYLNNKRELNVAKEWIVREHKEISIWKKKVSYFNNYIQFFIN
ncbi:unnamed protein product [Rhizophagus irregularis]|nr:unnamed protein product [Rhizophagus irregularis]